MPETTNAVLASLGSVPGRMAITFSRCTDLLCVRGAVASKRSTFTWSRPALSFEISSNRLTIPSRAQPMPRAGLTQEDSE